jgi:hypothetical protein
VSSEDTAAIPQDENAVGLNERLANVEQRIEELSWRMDRIANQIAQLSYRQDTNTEAVDSAAPQEEPADHTPETMEPESSTATAASEPSPPISSGLLNVIKLIAHGDAEAAQQKLYRLPEQELAGQPAVVALVAAALFVRRGDYTAGLKAIGRARQLTNNPRLLALSKLIEKQVGR